MAIVHVLNRYSEPIEVQYDAANNPESPYRWEPGEVKMLNSDVALFCRRKSVVREDPITGKQVRALVIQGIDKEFDEIAPMAHRGGELLDRTNLDAGAQGVTLVALANPQRITVADREGTPTESHTRRVP